MDDKTYSEPSDVTALDGTVKVDGPDAVDVGLTPDAADETGDRLIRKAHEARKQARGKPDA
jgi:hypothetical protein